MIDMKGLLLMTTMFLMFEQTLAQTPADPQVETDFLKTQLKELSERISEIQKNALVAKTDVQKSTLIGEITKRQIESVRLSGSFTERFSQGALATETILKALETGTTIGELSSPFVSPTIVKKYDKWKDRWGKFLPAIIIPSLSLSLNNLNSDQKLASVPIGISLTTIISGFSKNDSKKNAEVETGIKNIQSTMDLFDLNRMVYSDVQKLKSYISSANRSDSTLTQEFVKFWEENKKLFLKSDNELSSDQKFKTYINESQIYISRFQTKLSKIKFVLDHVESMIRSYSYRSEIRNYDLKNASVVLTETKNALDKVMLTYENFKSSWDKLQGKYYTIAPEELRQLDSYYELENLKLQTK